MGGGRGGRKEGKRGLREEQMNKSYLFGKQLYAVSMMDYVLCLFIEPTS